MERTQTPTEELLRGIAKALQREAGDSQTSLERETLMFLRASTLDALERISGTDA